MRQAKTQFSEGGLAHDVINVVAEYGIVPQIEFADVYENNKDYNHSKIIPELTIILDAYIKNDIHSEYPNWKGAIAPILDKEIGIKKQEFTFENQNFDPHSFREYLKIEPDNYISITSFTHKKFFSKFILNIPDNFSNGSFYNIPMDLMVSVVNEALQKGYTIALDADVSEPTFSAVNGIAVLPNTKDNYRKSTTEIVPEIAVTAEFRQAEFENFNTTDDHLMHITGLVRDQKGNTYFKVKNSWGYNNIGNGGFIYMSIPYFKLKTISILLHKDALTESIKNQLKI
jgi:bleomycin hydrolase